MKHYIILSSNPYYNYAAYTFEKIMTDLKFIKTEDLKKSDIIILMERSLVDDKLKELNPHAKIILFCFKSDVINFWDIDIDIIDAILIGNDSRRNIIYPWSNVAYEIEPPYIPVTETANCCAKIDCDVFVNLEEKLFHDLELLKIQKFLNKLVGYKIFVASKYLHNDFFNPHITVVSPDSQLDDYIEAAEIVIGAGYTAFKALLSDKKVIIIGERGFGSIPTVNNIEFFYNNFFQGNIGGRLDAAIPELLLENDFFNSPKDNKNIIPVLHDLLEKSYLKLCNIINSVIEKERSSNNLVFNPDYFISINGEDSWLLNKHTNLIIAKLEKNIANKLITFPPKDYASSFDTEELNELEKLKVLISVR